ncbi:MAG TPA: DUF2111 domain-containing protein [Methanomicrobiales archaeon]|nr:DUF2111 domain-containing protein [Methanomicrobiales archaeon]
MGDPVISAGSTAEDWKPLLQALHELLNRLPVTARSRDRPGIRIEEGRILDTGYTGPILEEAIARNELRKTTPRTGAYKGVPVTVAPVRNEKGEAIGAIGVVDITGIFDLATLMEHQSAIMKQICGKDPCPLPSEQVASKR